MRSLALCVAAGCGRIAFDPAGGDGAGRALGCPAFAQFCDGFESGDISAWSGADVSTGGMVIVTQERVHSGSFALAATMPMQSNGAAAAVRHDFTPISTGVLAVREWINTPLYRKITAGVSRADIAGYSVFIDDVVQADQHIGCQ